VIFLKDRISSKPGRVLITPENGSAAYYASLTRADEATQEGTPFNKASVLTDATAALVGLGADATPNQVFQALGGVVAGQPSKYKFVRRVITASGNVTLPAPSALAWPVVYFLGCGGGGGGGGGGYCSSSSYTAAGGGGGGGGAVKIFERTYDPASTSPIVISVTIGAGGAGGAGGASSGSAGSTGGTGGSTTVDGVTCVGGGGGYGSSSSYTAAGAAGGAGGSPGGGGGGGGRGPSYSTNPGGGAGGAGGAASDGTPAGGAGGRGGPSYSITGAATAGARGGDVTHPCFASPSAPSSPGVGRFGGGGGGYGGAAIFWSGGAIGGGGYSVFGRGGYGSAASSNMGSAGGAGGAGVCVIAYYEKAAAADAPTPPGSMKMYAGFVAKCSTAQTVDVGFTPVVAMTSAPSSQVSLVFPGAAFGDVAITATGYTVASATSSSSFTSPTPYVFLGY
jgi:hypothetical protein